MTLDTDPVPRPRDVAMVLRDLAWSIHRRVPEAATADPLPTTELALLKHVLDSPGLTVGELARRLGLRQPNTSAALRTLLERGLVVREPSLQDRRTFHIVPTEEALAEDEAIAAAWSGPLRAAQEQLSPEHAAALEGARDALVALDELIRGEQGERPRG
ncbi:MarR family winged helix-turn-helix transcriptional regulator [Brachybacterium fresconis]|uniref:DNA-binding MarR family transcriptional regulator n=1 Tax=Brachybacterium fresconis TaxID=173363 RepID=A0ABS4YIS1_9MICO|nr:MarR family transcriptional regulator [Brachybacterium fresconis]MBP2408644.1 DNA-binding MarR family transcriptional regulator [Brachybacterium fresconis]